MKGTVSCEQIAHPDAPKGTQTVAEIFFPSPPAVHACTADSADLPPLRSSPAGSAQLLPIRDLYRIAYYHIIVFGA